jgi:hypothetical protein
MPPKPPIGNGISTLDKPPRIIVTSASDVNSKTLAGTNPTAAAQSVLDYKTITNVKPSAATASTVTVGTNGVAASSWVSLDPYAVATAAVQVAVSGTVNCGRVAQYRDLVPSP